MIRTSVIFLLTAFVASSQADWWPLSWGSPPEAQSRVDVIEPVAQNPPLRQVPVAYVSTYAYQPILAVPPEGYEYGPYERRLSILGSNPNQSPAPEKPTRKPLLGSRPQILEKPIRYLAHVQQITLNILRELAKLRGPLQDSPANASKPAPAADSPQASKPVSADNSATKPVPTDASASKPSPANPPEPVPAPTPAPAPAPAPAPLADTPQTVEPQEAKPVAADPPVSPPTEAPVAAETPAASNEIASRSIIGRSKDSQEAITDPLTQQYFSNYLTPSGMPLQQVQFVPCMCPILAGFPSSLSGNTRVANDIDLNYNEEFAELTDLGERK